MLSTHWKAIKQFKKVNPSSIAQMIPADPLDQTNWLGRLFAFDEHLRRRTFHDQEREASWNQWLPKMFEWAAWNLGEQWKNIFPNYSVSEIVDYLVANPERFNTRWTVHRMVDEAKAWHVRVATMNASEKFTAEFHVPWDTQIDYSPLPNEARIEDLTFTALRSAKDLFDEGREMHHCVGDYARDVMHGGSRIYTVTVTETKKRLATVEFTAKRNKDRKDLWIIAQCKGPCNEDPHKDVGLATAKLLTRINQAPTYWVERADREEIERVIDCNARWGEIDIEAVRINP
jgi:hypothetical protein